MSTILFLTDLEDTTFELSVSTVKDVVVAYDAVSNDLRSDVIDVVIDSFKGSSFEVDVAG